MILGIPKEVLEQEGRVAAIPETVAQYKAMGLEVRVKEAAGEAALCTDESYARAGAEIVADAADLFARADLVLKVKQRISSGRASMRRRCSARGKPGHRFCIQRLPATTKMVRMRWPGGA